MSLTSYRAAPPRGLFELVRWDMMTEWQPLSLIRFNVRWKELRLDNERPPSLIFIVL